MLITEEAKPVVTLGPILFLLIAGALPPVVVGAPPVMQQQKTVPTVTPSAPSAVPVPAGPALTVAPAHAPAIQAAPGTEPLKGVVQIKPEMLSNLWIDPTVLTVKWRSIENESKRFWPAASKYENEALLAHQVAKKCSSKSYSAQDQAAAGCIGSETVNQCMKKLFKHCVETSNLTKAYKDAARDVVTEARVLSRMFARYADEAERNLNAQ